MIAEKQVLLKSIEKLNDEEVREILQIVRQLENNHALPVSHRKLAQVPTFKLPHGSPKFSSVKPARGKGIPASELLIKDRR